MLVTNKRFLIFNLTCKTCSIENNVIDVLRCIKLIGGLFKIN